LVVSTTHAVTPIEQVIQPNTPCHAPVVVGARHGALTQPESSVEVHEPYTGTDTKRRSRGRRHSNAREEAPGV
jgi:hypothetical protein